MGAFPLQLTLRKRCQQISSKELTTCRSSIKEEISTEINPGTEPSGSSTPVKTEVVDIQHNLHFLCSEGSNRESEEYHNKEENDKVQELENKACNSDKSNYNSKISAPSFQPSYKCEICHKYFTRLCDLSKHTIKIHSLRIHLTTKVQCKICGLSLATRTTLKRHVARFHPEYVDGQKVTKNVKLSDLRLKDIERNVILEKGIVETYIEFNTSLNMNVNNISSDKLLHTNDANHKNKNENLPLAAQNPGKDEVENRQEESKTEELVFYECDTCGKKMRARNNLIDHLRLHLDFKMCTCHVCGKQFRSKSSLGRHVRDVHDCIRKYPCDICGLRLKNRARLEDHLMTHTGERNHLCQVCGKAFKTKAALYIHNKFHAETYAYPCPKCEKKFKSKDLLKRHTLRHTGEKPHDCEFCGKSFYERKHLGNHILIHTNNEIYKCSICGKDFAQLRYLKNHERNHRKNSTKVDA